MSNCLYVDQLLSSCHILCLQEHHLFNENHKFDHYTKCGSYVIHGPRALVNVNADPRRNILINDFMLHTNLFSIVTCDICCGTRETFMPYDGSPGTQIGHILIDNSERINNIHMGIYIVHDDDALNSSDHKPLSLHIKVYVPTYLFQSRSLYRWDRADKTQYADILDQYIIKHGLSSITIDTNQDIDDLCNGLIACLMDVSDAVVPKSQYCVYRKPYWNNHLKQLHAEQLKLRHQWISQGKQRGPVFTSYMYVQYKQAKRQFAKYFQHYTDDYEQSQLHDISVSGDIDIRVFWKYIRRQKKEQLVFTPIVHDGVTYDTPE